MDALIKQSESTQEEAIEVRAEVSAPVEAISELASVELSYVGGGTVSMAFF